MTARYPLVLNGQTIEELQDGDTLTGLNSQTVGLGNVDNTSDANKPVSTAQQTALNLKANLISPALVTPALGTPASGNLANCSFPTLNQSTSGTAAKATILETARAIYGNLFDGSAALAQIIGSAFGGTGNGFTKFTGPTTSEKTFALPDSNQTLLYSGGALSTPASGVLVNCTGIPESGFKNIIINGGFTVNQRVYVSGATLAAGAYGHDRWKAGASGGDYSFTQLATNTTITIAANKTLIQVIEDKNVHRTSYTLSWTGTAQARYAVNSATPAGAYAASPIVITGQTVGTTMSVEFNAGTLGNVSLEAGSIATAFPFRSFASELALCQRYFFKTYPYGTAIGTATNAGAIQYICFTAGASYAGITVNFPVQMRVDPTLTAYCPSGTGATWYNHTKTANSGNYAAGVNHSDRGFYAINNPQVAGDAVNNTIVIHMTAEAEL
jgi:hypothetical protein